MDILQAIIIGLVQGLTEFLPVSSSAHLIFTQQALGLSDVGLAFDVLLHVGTLVAVVAYFFSDIISMIKGFFLSLIDLKDGKFMEEVRRDPYKKLAWLTIIATIPVGIVGVLFNDLVESLFTGITVPAFFLLITGCLLYVSQRPVQYYFKRSPHNGMRTGFGSYAGSFPFRNHNCCRIILRTRQGICSKIQLHIVNSSNIRCGGIPA